MLIFNDLSVEAIMFILDVMSNSLFVFKSLVPPMIIKLSSLVLFRVTSGILVIKKSLDKRVLKSWCLDSLSVE